MSTVSVLTVLAGTVNKFHCYHSAGKTPWSAELGFELGPAVQQASTLPTELCCTLHCYSCFKDFWNFPVIYCMKKVKCEHRVG
jgi:hypothetical protein